MTRFYIPMTTEEFVKLSELANRECRNPRDQARHILRAALLNVTSINKTQNRQDAETYQEQSIETVLIDTL